MSSDYLQTDFYCADCNEQFESASQLLTHFAVHANENKTDEDISSDSSYEDKSFDDILKKCSLPDLYPIAKPANKKKNLESIANELQSQKTKADGDPEEFNPLKFCLVTMDDKERPNSSTEIKKCKMNLVKRKYPCTLCAKVFGWSTDLKRHVLTHTGERPFKCKLCDCCFTRNFLLQKHEIKAHSIETFWKDKMPSLKPILTKASLVKVKESRKQSKQNIQRKNYYITNDSIQYKDILDLKSS